MLLWLAGLYIFFRWLLLALLPFLIALALAATVEPNFAEKELCDAYGVLDPALVPGKMLLSGEYAKLVQAINDLSGFNFPVEEDAKN